MKYILAIGLFFLPFITKAQTSSEEYNYVTKGYKAQVTEGLDMKKGYKLTQVQQRTFRLGSTTINKLIRTANNSIAAYMVIYKPNSGDAQFFCIPNPNSPYEVIQMYESTISADEDFLKLKMITLSLTGLLKWN